MSTHATHPTYSALSEDWSFSIEAKYASMRTLPDPFGIPGPSFMPSLSARTIPKFYPPDLGSAWKYGPKPFRSEAGALCAPTKWQRTAPRFRESSGGAQPARRKTVSLGLLGDQTLKFYHNPPDRTIPNRVPERTEGHGRLQFHRTVVRFLPQNTQNPALPDTEGGWEKMSSRHFNHNPVTGEGRAPSRPLASPHVHSSHRSGIGPARDVPAPPSARGARTQEVRNLLRPRERIHGYRRQIEDTHGHGHNKLRSSIPPPPPHTKIAPQRRAAGRCRAQAARDSTLPR